jgi:hypothetical protein
MRRRKPAVCIVLVPTTAESASLRIGAVVKARTLSQACEVHTEAKGNFHNADTDHDGHVTLQEFEACAMNRLAAANGPRAQAFKKS